MKARLVPTVAVLFAVLALFVVGCGSDSDGSSDSDPAGFVPPESPLYIEVVLQPKGELKANVGAMAERIAGVDDLGALAVSELESIAVDSDEPFDFDREVAPWLGETGGILFGEFDGEDFNRYGMVLATTEPVAAKEFAGKQRGDATFGIVDDYLLVAEDEETYAAMVDAAEGESLADADDFSKTFDAASSDSFADVFIDVGALINQSGGTIDPEAKQFLDSVGIDPNEATAVASLIPGSDQIEIDFSSDLGGQSPPSGDASGLLDSLPANSVAAFAAADFGDRFEEALDQIDTNGIPGEVPPGKFKSTLKEAGIDVDKIASSIGDLGVFAEGSGESSLAGAAVLTTKDAKEAKNTVSNVGLLLRASGTPGITVIPAIPDGAFSVRSPDLDRRLVIAARDKRIVIAYGVPATFRALGGNSDQSLADDPTYKEAVSALGGTPISGFADGPAALKLASALIPSDDQEDFREAKPYLAKIDYLAIGTGSSGELATAKLIAGIGDR